MATLEIVSILKVILIYILVRSAGGGRAYNGASHELLCLEPKGLLGILAIL